MVLRLRENEIASQNIEGTHFSHAPAKILPQVRHLPCREKLVIQSCIIFFFLFLKIYYPRRKGEGM